MAEYYLISQLPSLDGIGENTPLPITEERFLELCHRFSGKNAQKELEDLKLIPSRDCERSTVALIDAWNKGEQNLRLALGKVRADKLKKHFDMDVSVSSGLMQIARTAVEFESPMEAELFLNRYRLDFLESLRPINPFAESYLFYYLLKLKLLSRIRKFSEESGRSAYQNIYHSIMDGDSLEAEQ